MICAEYIWIDGYKPTAKLRSKTKIVDGKVENVSDLPEWGFDGSSTMQAEGHFSDCLLRPVSFMADPMRENDFGPGPVLSQFCLTLLQPASDLLF